MGSIFYSYLELPEVDGLMDGNGWDRYADLA
jgi:hypothetical protein